MPIDVSWYIPTRVLHVHVYDEAGTEQIQQMSKDLQQYFQEGATPIHILLDDSQASPPPISIKNLKSMLDITNQPTDKVGWVVGIGEANPIANIVVPILLKILRIKYLRLDTIDKAVAFLKKQDLSLGVSEKT